MYFYATAESVDSTQTWRFYAVMQSIKNIKQVLLRDKTIPFIAFTLFVEYSMIIKKKFKRWFKIRTKKNIVFNGLKTWLGETQKTITHYRTADEKEDAQCLIDFSITK